MSNKEFNFASALKSVKGVSISEYTLLSAKVARVIVNVVGSVDQREISDRISAIFENKATPIRASFRWLQQGRSAVGFIATQQPVRSFDTAQVQAKYTAIKANMFMDKSDESVWQVKPGSGGSYLSRMGEDNLAELIEASRVSPRGSTPRMSSIVAAVARPREMVAYVDNSGVVDYGFCLSSSNGDHVVVSSTTNLPTDVVGNCVVGVYEIDVPQNIQKAITSAKVTASGDQSAMIDYYKRLYSYSPDYLALVIKEIEAMAAA